MIYKINQAIAAKIKELYPAAEVYDEDVNQGFEEGSFFITVIDSSHKKAVSNRYKASVTYNLDYFPTDPNNPKNECYQVGDNVIREFELLGGYRVSEKSYSVTDNVLHIQFTVNYRELKITIETKMNQVNFNEGGN